MTARFDRTGLGTARGLRALSSSAAAALTMIALPALANEDAAAAAAGESAGLPQFKSEWFPSQIFWLAVTFVVLYVYFARVALPRLEQTMAFRQSKIQSDMAAADDLSKKAQTIREAYETDMNRARERAAETFKSLDDRMKAKTADRLYSFRTKFTSELARAESDLSRERERLVSELSGISAEAAALATSKILQSPADLDQARQVVDTLQKTKAA